MKLLLDQNLSPRLVDRLTDLYPDSVHVQSAGLSTALDEEIWAFAKQNQLVIVSKDADFTDLSLVYGSPPLVIWIRRGNCSTKTIESILRDNFQVISTFCQDAEASTLVLF